MSRETLIQKAKNYGYHQDTVSMKKLISENYLYNRILDNSYYEGVQMKHDGVRCGCGRCVK